MCQSTLGAELAVALFLSDSGSGSTVGEPYLHEVFAWSLLGHRIHRVREWAGIASLTRALPEELAWHMFGI